MVCSCTMPSNCVCLQIIFWTCVKKTVLFSFLPLLLCENGRSFRFPRIFIKKNKRGDWMIKQSLNSVITKYHDFPVSCRSIICLSLWFRQIIDLLVTDKSWYFAEPCPTIILLIIIALTGQARTKYPELSFEANFSFFSLAESPPRDLQITAYKICII